MHGVAPRRLSRVVSWVSSSQILVEEHGNKGKKEARARQTNLKCGWTDYLIGDKMPNSNQVHFWETQKDIYARDMQRRGNEDLISLGTFYRMWAEDCSCRHTRGMTI